MAELELYFKGGKILQKKKLSKLRKSNKNNIIMFKHLNRYSIEYSFIVDFIRFQLCFIFIKLARKKPEMYKFWKFNSIDKINKKKEFYGYFYRLWK